MSRIKAAMCDPFSHREVRRQGGQFREQLHGTHLCDAWNTNQQLKSLAKQIVLSDECHCFAPKFVDTKLQGCHGASNLGQCSRVWKWSRVPREDGSDSEHSAQTDSRRGGQLSA